MKSQLKLKLSVVITGWLLLLLLPACKNQPAAGNTKEIPEQREEGNDRATDLKGALEYEFNMLKNPSTGKIPEGIRDMELAQARQVLEKQYLYGRPDAINPYTFQGPNNLGGRTRALVYDTRFNGTSNQVILAGGVSGGIYKSTDNGATWVRKSPIGDLHSVSALAQDTRPGFQDTWYYGGGEFSGNSAGATGASYRGKGVYK